MASCRTLHKPNSADIMTKTTMNNDSLTKKVKIRNESDCTKDMMTLRCNNHARHVLLSHNDNNEKRRMKERVLLQGITSKKDMLKQS